MNLDIICNLEFVIWDFGKNCIFLKLKSYSFKKNKSHWLYLAKAAGPNSVDLFWDKTERATSWTVAYGKKSGVYPWGKPNFGDGNSRGIRIDYLPAGTYYFVVRANNNCMPGPFSNEKEAIVGGGRRETTTTFTGSGGGYGWPSTVSPTQVPQTFRRPTGQTISPTPVQRLPRWTSPTIAPKPTPAKPLGLWQRILRFFGLLK